MKQVLIVEDDPALLRGLSDNFAARGYGVETAMEGELALKKARRENVDLIVLDVMLPRVNGYEICRVLRREGSAVPIIFLTAKGEESDKLLGLGLGGDDYLTKPFSIAELLARAEAVLRRAGRSEAVEDEKIRFGGFVLDRGAHVLRRADGSVVSLSPKEYRLLSFFADHPGRAMSRDEIMNSVWEYDSRVTCRSIDRFVTTLRKKIETDPRRPEWIETIREFGYRFRAPD